MACFESGNVTICRPHVDAWSRFYARCPCCRKRRLILSEFQDYYGSRNTCLSCGREWMGGEPLERTTPKRRSEAKTKAREAIRRYRAAGIPSGWAGFREKLEREIRLRMA